MSSPAFSIDAAVQFGWEKTKKHLGTLVLIGIIAFAISIASGIVFAWRNELSFVGWALRTAVQIALAIGITKAMLLIAKDVTPKFKDVIPSWDVAVNFVLASILYCLIVVGGFILFVIPGVMWSIEYKYFSYLVIEKEMKALDALKHSAEITKGQKWSILGFVIVAGIVTLLGALALGIGLIVAIPTASLAEIYVYHALNKK